MTIKDVNELAEQHHATAFVISTATGKRVTKLFDAIQTTL
jgi:hypothetical protein